MKFTLSWLKQHLETEASIDEIVERMTMIGLEVESVEDAGAKLAAFTIARVISAEKHPNADKLRVCQVETKLGQLEIVCGAPNARAGLVTAFAPIGTFIPGTGITLEAKPVRGVISNGMLCSGAELELDADADGILELDSNLKVGTPLAEALGLNDPVIDIEVTPNRPDWLGVVGIARDLAAAGLGKFVANPIEPIKGAFASEQTVATEAPEACLVFAGRLIRGVKNGPSPAWLQQRLRAVALRPRNALVDITNLISLDRARPLHVYDAAKLKGVVRARMGKSGESFKALDGNEYAVTPDQCVIADDTRVLGYGGIMGGEYSGCSETTTDVLIESAYFDPTLTHATGRATGIVSDALYRNARGIDPESCADGIELATKLVLEFCGGEPSEIMIAGQPPPPPRALSFDPGRTRALAGIEVSAARSKEILAALGFEIKADGKKLSVQPPSWRRDVEGPADLVEEIARIEGFDKMPETAPPRASGFRAPPASVGESRVRLGRRACASLGYDEAVTWSFCSRAHAAAFGGGGERLMLANPISSDLDCMRPSALPNLLVAAQKNADRGFDDARLFEAGPIYLDDSDAGQQRAIAAVWRARPPRHWRAAHMPDIFDVKRDVMTVLEAIGAPVASLQAASDVPAHWRPGKAGALRLGNKAMAIFGEIHPRALKALDVEAAAMAFEIFIDALPAPRAAKSGKGRAKPPLEKLDLMPLTRDFAFVVDDKIAAADLVRAALGADKALIADVSLFDVYRGERMAAGKKSLAIEVTLQPREKTLTDAEIEAAGAKVVSAVMKATGGVLRG
jgi:phenylalanyl-tRNA synthetase beta chain